MSVNPAVSVIIPVFNLEKYLRDAIESVRAQTFHDLEMILVDDGSTDGSREVIERYSDPDRGRVRALFRKHAGAAAARNAGIAAAAGEWLAFLDGDDLWLPGKLARQMEAAARDRSINMVATAVQIDGSQEVIPRQTPDPARLRAELLLHGCLLPLSGVLIRRDGLGGARFDERLESAQDLDLYYRISDRIRLAFIPEALVVRRERPGSISDPDRFRFMQLHRLYRLTFRELQRLRRHDRTVYDEVHGAVAHKLRTYAQLAAYESLLSRKSTFLRRIQLAAIALRQRPFTWKSLRFFAQSFFPAAFNRFLHRQRHRDRG